MELLLERDYHPSGTDGILSCAEQFICFTIELPWRNNKRKISCIPEGRYPLALRFSEKHLRHLQVLDVPNRSLILIHKANNALLELEGCIGPVMESIEPGVGKQSELAFRKLYRMVCDAMSKGERVWLNVTRLSKRYGQPMVD